MALRVLLADESSTIKKAIQLVLSEYGVEVKTVPTGIDVLAVAQTFSPDIVIADILLNKKNGYEVCLELKNNENTKNIPVILMWSSFMQLDEQLFKSSQADASLEKPFEAETIKALFERLVPKLQAFPLRGLLNYASLPDFEESDTFVRQKNTFNTLITPDNSSPASSGTFVIDQPLDFNIPSTNENEQNPKLSFKQKLLQKQQKAKQSTEFAPVQQTPAPELHANQNQSQPSEKKTHEHDDWSPAKTNQFVIETENYGDFEEVKVVNALASDSSTLQGLSDQIRSYIKDSPGAAHRAQTTLQKSNSSSSFDEQLIKEEIRQIAERICWQVIPEITEKIVREELSKLLQGIEKNT